MNPIRKANVYIGDVLAGSLEKTPRGGRFTYDPTYLESERPLPVSSTLPISKEPYQVVGVNLLPFFANLLPEGLRLDAIQARTKASRDDRLTILVASGSDTIGDVSVVDPSVPTGTSDQPIDLKEITLRQAFNDRYGLNTLLAEKVSIPGVQEKVSASRIAGNMTLRDRRHSAFILKLNLAQERRPCLIENEDFFMRMARDCGLIAADCEIVTDSLNEKALAVRRFDRIFQYGCVMKLHQEDGCQILDRYPDHKYDISIQEIAMGLQRVCSAPAVEILRLLELFAFSYLIGNGDLHAKNISTLRDAHGITRLSPAYDILSTWPYRDFRMALKLDGRDRKFKASHFVSFGSRFGVKEKAILNMLDRLYSKSESWLDRVGEIGLPDNLAGPLHEVMSIRRSNIVRPD